MLTYSPRLVRFRTFCCSIPLRAVSSFCTTSIRHVSHLVPILRFSATLATAPDLADRPRPVLDSSISTSSDVATRYLILFGGSILTLGFIAALELSNLNDASETLPARKCNYRIADPAFRAHTNMMLSEPSACSTLSGCHSAAIALPCFYGRAVPGEDTHHVHSGSEHPTANSMFDSGVDKLDTKDAATMMCKTLLVEHCHSHPERLAHDTELSVCSHLGFTQEHVRQLEREGMLVLDGFLSNNELARIQEDLIHIEQPKVNPNQASAAMFDLILEFDSREYGGMGAHVSSPFSDPKQQEFGSGGAHSSTFKTGTVARTDRTLFLDGSGRRQDRLTHSSLAHAERLLRSLGAALEDAQFRGFAVTENGHQCNRDKMEDLQCKNSSSSGLDFTSRQPLIVPEQTQLALYGASRSFYRPHRDGYAFSWDGLWLGADGPLTYLRNMYFAKRAVTGILYLNDNNATVNNNKWCASDGGCLRIYMEGSTRDSDCFVDIPPIGGRLVLFDSERILHEVRPCYTERWAITVWFLKG